MKLRTILLCSGAAVFALGAIAFAATDEGNAAAESEAAAAEQPAELSPEALAELEASSSGLPAEVRALLEQELALAGQPAVISPEAIAELNNLHAAVPEEVRALLEQELAMAGQSHEISPEALAELQAIQTAIPEEVRAQLEEELYRARSISTAPAAPAAGEAPAAGAAPCPFAWSPDGSHSVYVHGMPAPPQLEAARERLLSEIAALMDSGELSAAGAEKLESVIEELGESMKAPQPAQGDHMFFAPGAAPMGFAFPAQPAVPGFGGNASPQVFSMPLPPPHAAQGEWLQKNQSLSIEMDENGEVTVSGEGFSEEELDAIRDSIKQYGHWKPEDFGMFAVPALPPHGVQSFYNHAVPQAAPPVPGAQGEWQHFYHPAPGFTPDGEWQSEVDELMSEIGELLREFMEEHEAKPAEAGSGSN